MSSFCGKDGALGSGVPRHRRDFFELQASDESRSGRDTTPAVEFPARAEEFNFGTQGNVENHFSGATVELLWKPEDRTFAEAVAIRGAPDGDVKGFLLDLIGDGEDAEEGAGDGFRNVDRRAVAV